MSGYASYKASRKSWGIDAIGSIIVEVELTNGMVGVGISIGGEAGCSIIERHLARFVEGQDPKNVELIWDQMWRSTINYGRKGLPIQCISAIDIALWDVLGKLRNEPVYQLLGGRTKGKVPVYATTARPDLAYQMGFKGAKFPLPYGPADGQQGMNKNIERIKQVRASIPDQHFPIMIDCYMALTVPYTIELAKRIDREVPNGVKWIEEHLPPDDYEGYAEVKRQVSGNNLFLLMYLSIYVSVGWFLNVSSLCVCIFVFGQVGMYNLFTCGEHEYTRYGFRQLLEKKCKSCRHSPVSLLFSCCRQDPFDP
jgi:L-rhamnonate dehydratase